MELPVSPNRAQDQVCASRNVALLQLVVFTLFWLLGLFRFLVYPTLSNYSLYTRYSIVYCSALLVYFAKNKENNSSDGVAEKGGGLSVLSRTQGEVLPTHSVLLFVMWIVERRPFCSTRQQGVALVFTDSRGPLNDVVPRFLRGPYELARRTRTI